MTTAHHNPRVTAANGAPTNRVVSASEYCKRSRCACAALDREVPHRYKGRVGHNDQRGARPEPKRTRRLRGGDEVQDAGSAVVEVLAWRVYIGEQTTNHKAPRCPSRVAARAVRSQAIEGLTDAIVAAVAELHSRDVRGGVPLHSRNRMGFTKPVHPKVSVQDHLVPAKARSGPQLALPVSHGWHCQREVCSTRLLRGAPLRSDADATHGRRTFGAAGAVDGATVVDFLDVPQARVRPHRRRERPVSPLQLLPTPGPTRGTAHGERPDRTDCRRVEQSPHSAISHRCQCSSVERS
mmetsp:Transcript_15164/g.45081  ORF Transcript_15164/g.45081 Transcript_15164/m.45081 type:complete len:295 (-) Transcript_15164:311-1195(-)